MLLYGRALIEKVNRRKRSEIIIMHQVAGADSKQRELRQNSTCSHIRNARSMNKQLVAIKSLENAEEVTICALKSRLFAPNPPAAVKVGEKLDASFS